MEAVVDPPVFEEPVHNKVVICTLKWLLWVRLECHVVVIDDTFSAISSSVCESTFLIASLCVTIIMLNRRISSMESNPNGGGATFLSSSPGSTHFMYSRSISTPSPSLPKAIPFPPRTIRSRSVFAGQNGNLDGNFPPSSAPVTFNRYINVKSNNNSNGSSFCNTPEAESSPSSSWYSRLSSSLKKSVLRRTTSYRETAQKKLRAGHRRSVIISLIPNDWAFGWLRADRWFARTPIDWCVN